MMGLPLLAVIFTTGTRAQTDSWESTVASAYQAYQSGRFREAEGFFRTALDEARKLPEDNPRLATSLNNLAALYDTVGRYTDAEPLYRQALDLMEKTLGPRDPNVATALNNLAELYRAQGLYQQAEALHSRSLGIRESSLGPGHPDVAQSLNNLGRVLDLLGRYPEAEKLYVRSLEIRRHALGARPFGGGANGCESG